ncbi:MAG: glycoside hydrolase family 88 protein [Treponema sp.]|jgi:unsaturated chondroitin disaccharide hydrolase|nr:glycoside hydrolase family 88 protein [Treponema sp.]
MITVPHEAQDWAQQIWRKIEIKMSAQCGRLGVCAPYAAINGRYTDKMTDNIYWWTNGFWPGMLWIMYHAGGEDRYLKTARAIEERLDAALAGFEGLHHDVGFMWMLASVLDWRLTSDKDARRRALHAVNLLAGRYNPRGRFIRAWNRDCTGWIIIDCMMNLSLLYWAAAESEDPRFKFIAMDHADTALKFLLREDGSCAHIAVLDPQSGTLLEIPAGQGYASGSSWTRGQAWALYGFTISYCHTGEIRYREAAARIARYFCDEIARYAYVPPVDFRAPDEPRLIDTSAGAIAACGLLALHEIDGSAGYGETALKIVQALEAAHGDWDSSTDGIIKMATAQYHGKTEERHVPLIYGDYFFLEALNRLCGRDLQIW